jgi:hypothetical protein
MLRLNGRGVSKKKLINGFGVLLVLGAWFLEWNSMNYWKRAVEEFYHNVGELSRMSSQIAISSEIREEASIARAVRYESSDPVNPFHFFELAWKNPEVRYEWIRDTVSATEVQVTLIELVEGTLKEHGMLIPDDLSAQKVQLRELKQAILKGLNDTSRKRLAGSSVFPSDSENSSYLVMNQDKGLLVDPSRLEASEALRINGNLQALQTNLSRPVNQVASALRDRSEKASHRHKWVFALGSILLLTAAFLEAFVPEDSNTQTRRKNRR